MQSNQSINIYIYIYIYKQSPHVREHEVLPCDALYEKIGIFLIHIRDKNQFKNNGSLFLLVQCFKTNFYYIFYSMF